MKCEVCQTRITREFCARCAIKHLAQAQVLMLEARKGYPHHVWIAMGHMAEAEDEILDLMPKQAQNIRAFRMIIEEALRWNLPEHMGQLVPRFQGLMYDVATEALLEEISNQNQGTPSL